MPRGGFSEWLEREKQVQIAIGPPTCTTIQSSFSSSSASPYPSNEQTQAAVERFSGDSATLNAEAEGVRWVVVASRIALRERPSLDAAVVGAKVRGKVIEVFEWDDSRQWRRTVSDSTCVTGWVLLDSPEHGPLLRPLGKAPVRKINPLQVAVEEGREADVACFLAAGCDPNFAAADGQTTLMSAAEEGNLRVCARLLLAKADPNKSSLRGTAMDVARSKQAQSLLEAFAGIRGSSTDYLPLAVAALEPDLGDMVELRLLEIAKAQSEEDGKRSNDLARSQEKDREKVESNKSRIKDRAAAMMAQVDRGVEWQVVGSRVAVREKPQIDSTVVGAKVKGKIIQLFEWDSTWSWRRTVSESTNAVGWVMLDSPEYGPLLRPVNHVTAGYVDPLRVATEEGNEGDVQSLLAAGFDPEGMDEKGKTTLMAAAEEGNLCICARLLLANADPTRCYLHRTAADFAYSSQVRALLEAMGSKGTCKESEDLDQALAALDEDLRERVEGMLHEFTRVLA